MKDQLQNYDASLFYQCGAKLAEGPLYNMKNNFVYWVDIPDGVVWRKNFNYAEVSSINIEEPIGSLSFTDCGGLVVAGRQGLFTVCPWSAAPRLDIPVEPDAPSRFNDGKCSPDGRFVGGVSAIRGERAARLLEICSDGTTSTLLDDVGMPNGLDWSVDGKSFYFIDSRAGTINEYSWPPTVNGLSFVRTVVAIPSGTGLPDGMTVDSSGHIWVAIWGAGRVHRYTPEGRLCAIVTVPTEDVSSCTFAGPDLSHLVITTARSSNNPRTDSGGDVYLVSTDARGRPPWLLPCRNC